MCGLEQYKGFLIDGSAVPTFATGFDWHSQESSYVQDASASPYKLKASTVPSLLARVAEQHGLKLCKDWIDKRP
jgi:hypothetical protein